MIVQTFSLQYPDEALACIEAGADWLGLLTGDPRCPAAVTAEQAKAIFDAIGDKAKKTAIIMERNEQRVIETCEYLRPDTLQLCDETVFATPSFRDRLKHACPAIRLMQAVGVRNAASIDEAKSYEGAADFLLLDSVDCSGADWATQNVVGAAGVTHDWNISRAIVKETRIPVILAGGLGPDNVEAAVRFVRPYGVDSLTKTTIVQDGVYIRKDLKALRLFVERAQQAARCD